MYPAGAPTPTLDDGGAAPDDMALGCDPLPCIVCATSNSGRKNNASVIVNHPAPIPILKRFKPALEPDRRSDTDLIVIEAEEIHIADVLAVQVIHPCTQPPGNQYVKRRLDKPVIIIPRSVEVTNSSEVIRVFIPGAQPEVKAME
jgi:hypothetical protein